MGTNNFNFYYGNKLDVLAKKYSENTYRKTRENLLAKDYIIVPTIGIGSYLKLFLAEGDSTIISANIELLFMNQFVNKLFQDVYSKDFSVDVDFYSCESMTLAIYSEIQNNRECYTELDSFISGADGQLKCYQLSNEIAKLFDKYFIYSPEILDKWRSNKTSSQKRDWQERLYLKIFENKKSYDQYFSDFFKLEKLPEKVFLPQEITIFGVSSMSPMHLEFFNKLSSFIEVNLFHLNPCRAYWAEIETKERKHLYAKLSEDEQTSSNQILSALGEAGRSFCQDILDKGGLMNEIDCFEEYITPEVTSPNDCSKANRLMWLKTDVLRLFERKESLILQDDEDFIGTSRAFKDDDQSITINNCHGILREVEVLYDYLMRSLENDNIMPRDIIVMAPDIDKYTSSIQAVFANSIIPYSISDRSLKSAGSVMLGFSKLLKIGLGRFEANEVVELLSFSSIYKKFEISEVELDKIKEWIINAKISWGINGKNHAKFCDVDYDDFSWKSGLKRLLLGLMVELPDSDVGLWDVLPIDDGIGNPVLLGRFCKFLRMLFDLDELQNKKMKIDEWCDNLKDIVEKFFCEDKETLKEIASIRSMLDKLSKISTKLSLGNLILSFDVVCEIIENNLNQTSNSDNFLRGKVTFCSMVPMRSIPMKIVAVLGLNDNEFPRREKNLTFDISSKRYKNRVSEERYLFLEAILSAKDSLYLSYKGQSIKNKEETPPCVPLGELYDYLHKFYGVEITKQALWPFDERYFSTKENKLNRSYFEEYHLLAENLNQKQSRKIVAKEVENDKDIPPIVPLKELISAFSNHPAWYLQKHAALYFSKYDEELTVSEPDESDRLIKYAIRKSIYYGIVKKVDRDKQLTLMRKKGILPVGAKGTGGGERAYDLLSNIPEEILCELSKSVKTPLEITIDNIKIIGSVDIYKNNYYLTIFFKLKWKYAINAFIHHLFINACGLECDTYILELEKDELKKYKIEKIDSQMAKTILKTLLDLYVTGFKRPLPIFEVISNLVATSRESDIDKLRAKASKAFYEDGYDGYPPAEISSIPTKLLFGDGQIFNDDEMFKEFCSIAKLLYPTITVEK